MKRMIPVLCLLLSLLIVIISMSTISFSWFEPDTKTGSGLHFMDDTKLRAQTCNITKILRGQKDNTTGKISYTEIENKSITLDTDPVTTEIDEVAYFKTIISNESSEYDTVISLYLKDITIADSSARLCVAYPTNSVRKFTSTQSDVHIIRNAYVPMLVETDANPGQLIVEWFVKCDTGSVTFDLCDLYLMYS